MMKKLVFTSGIILLVLALTACGAAVNSRTDAVIVLENYYDALTAGDLEKAMSFVDDNAVFIDPMGKYVGKENIRKVYAPQMNIGGRWEPSEINDVNGKGRLVYDFTAYLHDSAVYSGTGLTVVKDGKIIFDGSERTWEGECKRDPTQSFCAD
jgi:ketosteroid isomerase-like protein